MHFLRFCACHENTSNLVPKSSRKRALGTPNGLKNEIEKQCKNRQRILMIFGAFWEPLGPYLGAIWCPKWPPKRTLGPHGASRPSQMTPKSLLGPPRVVGVPKWGFSVPRNDSLSMVLRSCLWLTEKPGNPTPARGSSKMGPLSNTARHGNYNNYINRKLVKSSRTRKRVKGGWRHRAKPFR